MKVQWQLVDIETGNSVKVGEVFELIDFMKRDFGGETEMPYSEARKMYGDIDSIKNPIGVLNLHGQKEKTP